MFSGRFKEWSFSSVELGDHLDDRLDDRLDHLDGQLDHPANILNLTNELVHLILSAYLSLRLARVSHIQRLLDRTMDIEH